MREDPTRPFRHDWRQMSFSDKNYDNWKDKLLAKTEGDWAKAAYDKVEKISAKFRTTQTPPKAMHDFFCDCSSCQPNHRKYIKGIR